MNIFEIYARFIANPIKRAKKGLHCCPKTDLRMERDKSDMEKNKVHYHGPAPFGRWR